MRIAGATVNQIPLDWENNLENIAKAIRMAKEKNVRILCLPELCLTGYGCEDLFLSEWLSDKAWKKLQDVVPLCDNVTVSIGLPVKYNGQTYKNSGFKIQN